MGNESSSFDVEKFLGTEGLRIENEDHPEQNEQDPFHVSSFCLISPCRLYGRWLTKNNPGRLFMVHDGQRTAQVTHLNMGLVKMKDERANIERLILTLLIRSPLENTLDQVSR